MNEIKAKELIERYSTGQASEEEFQAFKEWLVRQPDTEIERLVIEYDAILSKYRQPGPVNSQWLLRLLEKLGKDGINQNPVIRQIQKLGKVRYAAIAAVLITFAMTSIYFLGHTPSSVGVMGKNIPVKNDVFPASDKATLTLADGTVVVLDSIHTGSLANQGGTSVEKVSQGKLAYHSGANNPAKVLINGVSTPRGGKYQVVLPDGTTVLLNAASLLKFPTAFTGNDRRVELTGEAYFSVSKDAARPFIIVANGMQVMVTGTEFDVMAYADEQETKTTLISGGVKVVQGNTARVLKPGQEAAVNKSTNELRVIPVDTTEAAAWTKGFFNFEAATVPSIMREISRWYDVEVLYEGTPPDRLLTGKAPRNITLFRLQQILALNNIHFTIEGKTIRVQS